MTSGDLDDFDLDPPQPRVLLPVGAGLYANYRLGRQTANDGVLL